MVVNHRHWLPQLMTGITLSLLTACVGPNSASSPSTAPVSVSPTPVSTATVAPGNATTTALLKKSPRVSHYMIYYGQVTPSVVATAKQYPLVILNPNYAGLTRAMVADLQSAGTKVILYLSIGEDLRTTQFFNGGNINYTKMLADPRFVGNGLGPTIDPRVVGPRAAYRSEWPLGAPIVDYVGPGNPSTGGIGYASYYLNDVGLNGKPDFDVGWGAAYVNAGDPTWFDTLQTEQFANDGQYGIDEMLTTTYGAGLGADGLFLDTLDTCGPNPWTNSSSVVETRYEWTAPGFQDFIRRLRNTYPSAVIVQNRGTFFFNRDCSQYAFTTRTYIDYLMFESYYLDSNAEVSPYFDDNRYNYMPKISAEASRPDGFEVLALDYRASNTATVSSQMVSDAINQSETVAGFRTYLSNGSVTDVNTVALTTDQIAVGTPAPAWSSTVSASYTQGPSGATSLAQFPPMSSTQVPRTGLQTIYTSSPTGGSQAGTIYLDWDVALGRDPVDYVAYYSYGKGSLAPLGKSLAGATSVDLGPLSTVGRGYLPGTCSVTYGPYPFEASITGLKSGQTVEIVVRACRADNHNVDDGNMNIVSITVP